MITSLQNKRIKHIVRLRKRSKYRDQHRKIIIQSYRTILRAVENDYPIDTLYYCPDLFLGSNEPDLIQQVADMGAQVIEVAEAPFRKIANRVRPEGLLAVAPQRRRNLSDYAPVPNGFYLVTEAIEKPGNLGAILRSADGAGVDGVIVCDPWTDLFHPAVVRASVGTFFSVLTLESTTEQAIAWCQLHGVRILAATPYADTIYTNANMCDNTIAVAVGTEQYGLSDAWMQRADVQIKLPMLGKADSLNVATAATLLLYEVVRQRYLE